MRVFAPSMFPMTCTILPLLTTVTDEDGGVVESFGPPSGPVPCRVRYVGTRQAVAGFVELGTTAVIISFPTDPGVAVGWRLVSGAGRRHRALGPAQARDAGGYLWSLNCEVID